MLTLVPVDDETGFAETAALAARIWREYYTPLIGSPQVEYMISRFQSEDAIRNHVRREGYGYFMAREDGKAIGYLAVGERPGELFLSKFYVEASFREKGVGRRMMAFAENLAKEKGLGKITLTVNKRNFPAHAAYERLGFRRTSEIVQDIGGGFVMDDYVFEKTLKKPRNDAAGDDLDDV
jgi:ribosomal protein S18 acetylase RimI-like enzyme